MESDATWDTEALAGVLERARAGDADAFGELVRAHYETIFRLVFSIVRDEHEARDVCQEVWLAAWRALHRFRGDARFTTWVHPIAVRRAIDHLRRKRRWYARFLPFLADRETGAEVEVVDESAKDPREGLERGERDARFERALEALPPKHRAVLALREVQGLSYEEIAKTLNLRPGTVMSRLHNARRLLARKLEDRSCE